MDLTPLNLETLALKLDNKLETLNGTIEEKVHCLVATLSHIFKIDINEVAVYHLDEECSILKFLWPEKLKHIGAIPYSSFDSLAARTAREGVVLLENSFAARRHASAYEKIRLNSGIAASPKPIQKIISAPIFKGEAVRGVIQLSRKGNANDPQLQDFTDSDADALLALARIFGQHF